MNNPLSNLKVDRIKEILNLIHRQKRISIQELEGKFQVSRITLQRDLVDMENRGLIKRFHGGAMPVDYSNYSQNHHIHDIRKTINVKAKQKIAQKAVSYIKPDQYIGLDPSSTVYYMSTYVFPENIFIVSCGMDTFLNLSNNSGIKSLLTGGTLNRKTQNLSGPEAIDTIRKYHYDLVFISADSYIPDKGFFARYEDETLIKKAFIDSSKKTIMLLDASKFKPAGGLKICGMEHIDYLVTNYPAKERHFIKYRDKIVKTA